jgi:hypothetical protein
VGGEQLAQVAVPRESSSRTDRGCRGRTARAGTDRGRGGCTAGHSPGRRRW